MIARAEAVATLTADPDGFARRLSRADLRARGGHRDAAAYLAAAAASLPQPTDDDARRVEHACRVADARLAAAPPGTGGLDASDLAALASMPWRVALSSDAYEGGLPHTRGDVVFVPPAAARTWPDDVLVGTLAHEKTHVYQRLRPARAAAAAARLGCFPGTPARPPSAPLRGNPDLDGVVYFDARGAPMAGAPYASADPRGLWDVTRPPSDLGEHPFEATAYAVGGAAAHAPFRIGSVCTGPIAVEPGRNAR